MFPGLGPERGGSVHAHGGGVVLAEAHAVRFPADWRLCGGPRLFLGQSGRLFERPRPTTLHNMRPNLQSCRCGATTLQISSR